MGTFLHTLISAVLPVPALTAVTHPLGVAFDEKIIGINDHFEMLDRLSKEMDKYAILSAMKQHLADDGQFERFTAERNAFSLF